MIRVESQPALPWEGWFLAQVGDTNVKRMNTFEFCELGKALALMGAKCEAAQPIKLRDYIWPGIRLYRLLAKQVGDKGIFLQSSKRAAGALMRQLAGCGIPKELDELEKVNPQQELQNWEVSLLKEKIAELETVLSNDLPGLATYYVSPKGIYSTDDLISHADLQIPEGLRSDTPAEAKNEIAEAGKCLAYEVSTASAFHMWRAVELIMDAYYVSLTEKTFAEAGITRNWGKYIEALTDAKAEERVTQFLDHIRKEYRNPISHPDETLDLDEAFSLFGAGFSAITQMLREIQRRKPLPLLESAGLLVPVMVEAKSGV